MKIHELKTWTSFFDAVLDGTKTFEVRRNDRGFKVGDRLDLMEFSPESNSYTGRHCHRFISYILDANPFLDMKDMVILGIKTELQPMPSTLPLKTAEDLINSIIVNEANFKHIAETGSINGTLLSELRRILREHELQFKPSTSPLKTAEVIKPKLENILCDYYTDDEYSLDEAVRDIFGLFKAESTHQEVSDFPDIDFRRDIAEELSRNELIDRLCEMNKSYREMREEWFKVVQMKAQPDLRSELISMKKRAELTIKQWGNDMSKHSIESKGVIMVCDHILGFLQSTTEPQVRFLTNSKEYYNRPKGLFEQLKTK